jgi:hypothetical protein
VALGDIIGIRLKPASQENSSFPPSLFGSPRHHAVAAFNLVDVHS